MNLLLNIYLEENVHFDTEAIPDNIMLIVLLKTIQSF